eukprot:maker-scaffold83_size396513-snap-gene-0.15 protein:Tk00958 transcript:maker-scaffold83_size396513-snap-gene-0.15-mRNA-1 annotation:"conserved hypothetical protein"
MECLGQLKAANSLPRLDRVHGDLPNPGCMTGCFPSARIPWTGGEGQRGRNRKPITALASQGFWNGVSDIKEVFAPSNPLLNTKAQFYLPDQASTTDYKGRADQGGLNGTEDEDQFFEDITLLYRRQTMLFERSCEQLKDLYELDLSGSSGSLDTSSVRTGTPSAQDGGQQRMTPFGEIETADVEDLYIDCVYSVLHMIGCDVDQSDQWALVEHLRKAFHLDPKRHLELYETASSRPKPPVSLNLSVLQARDMASKDISGINDPFCTFYVKSNPGECFNTGCKVKTFEPNWNEHFVIELPPDKVLAKEERDPLLVLHLDVWNFHPDEKFREKLKRINDVKDSRGFRQFIVDTVNTKKGQINHKLIGSVEIPIHSIPACGFKKWWTLEKLSTSDSKSSLSSNSSSLSVSGGKPRGEIHLQVHLSTSDKPHQTIINEHQRLLRILLSYELLNRNASPYSWKDSFNKETLQILAQHAVQGRMSRDQTALARWFVYCQTHFILPLDYRVFPPILDKLRKYLQSGEVGKESLEEFHRVADTFTTHCLVFIRSHRRHLGSNFAKYHVQLDHVLKCLHVLHCLKWRTKGDIVIRVEEALRSSVCEWFHYIETKVAKTRQGHTAHERMAKWTRLTHILIADVKSSQRDYGDIFCEALGIHYGQIAYRQLEVLISGKAKPLVSEVCELLKPLSFSEDYELTSEDFDFSLGTSLFELYLALQQFYQQGSTPLIGGPQVESSSDGPNDAQQYPGGLSQYHKWFIRAVAKWLDIALFKAIKRILKAVELDNLGVPVDELVKHTSSAVDIRTVLGQIKTFWHQLKWPDPETAYVFVSRILDDVCRAAIFYAEKMCAKVEHQFLGAETPSPAIYFAHEQCYAVNNIEYVLQAINPLLVELGMGEIIEKIEALHGGLVADACKRTVRTLVRNAVENVENQILHVFDQLGSRMSPTIGDHLHASLACACPSHLKTLQFLDENLIFLKDSLVPANFERVLVVIWLASASTLSTIMDEAIREKRSVPYFSFLFDTFRVLLNFFYGDALPNDPSLIKTAKLLRMYASDVKTLVNFYYRSRYLEQSELPTNSYPCGSITIKAVLLQGSHLRIEVLNARHLKPVEVIAQEISGELQPMQTKDDMDALGRNQHRSHMGHGSISSGGGSISSSSSINMYSTFPRRHSMSHFTSPKRNAEECSKWPWSEEVEPFSDEEPIHPRDEQLELLRLPTPRTNGPQHARILTLRRIRDHGPGDHSALGYYTPVKRLPSNAVVFQCPSPTATLARSVSSSGDDVRFDYLKTKLDSVRLSVQGAHVMMHKNFGSSRQCNPYVTIKLVPTRAQQSERLKARTKVQERTLFPLFDETFDLVVPPEIDVPTTFLHLTVKDRGVMGEGIFLGEAYLPLQRIQQSNLDISLPDLGQIQLPLTRPPRANHEELLFAIQTRCADSSTRDFLRKERRKMLL